ncbi:MAG: S9 family peptidase [Planctomycetes bacterium]|nr:S9 family peptidase [Planctomycetota bacterium]
MHPIADYLNIHSASAGRFSPDGREVIYLSDETGTFQVWKVGVDGAGRAQLTQDRGERVMQAVWSPSEERLLFERDAGGNERWQILSMRPDGSETEPLVESSDHIHHFGDFAPDGKSFCYYANSRDVTHFDVYVCEFESRQSRLVFEGEGLNTVEAFSPDGKAILVRKHLSNVEQELFLIDIKGGARRKITTAPARYEHCRFAPDGTVFCLSDQGRDFLGVAQISPAKAALSWVVAEEWDVDLLDVASDGTIIAYALNRDGLSELVVKEVATGDEIELPEVGPWVITDLRFSLDGKTIAVSHHHATVNPNVTVIDLEAVAATQVTDASLATIDPAGFVAPELVRYPTFDGRTIPCFVSIPRVPPPAGGYPVIVDIHGGPESQRRPEFFAHFQYYLAQGYAVFSPNVRGSTGYGRAFQALDDVRRREDSVKDIGALFDFIRQDKRANPARVGLYGASYGGFMALAAAAAFPEHWAAAVDVVGVVNFRTFLEHTAPWRRRYRENEYGSLEADGEFLDGLSPIHHVDRISCPLLIIHGRNDSRVPVSEAEQLAAAVRKLGRVAELVIYPDEGHGITKRVNRLDCYPRVANFFKIWVFEGKKAPAPKPPQPPPVPAQPSLVVADGGRKPAVSAPPAAPGE